MSGWSLVAGNYALTYTCSNNNAQLFSLNAAGQIEAGGSATGLCISSQGSPSASYPYVLQECDTTIPSQIFEPMCPPAPPPPIASVPTPCGGNAAQYAMSYEGKQMCLTINPGAYLLTIAACALTSTQLWTGVSSSTGMVVANNGCVRRAHIFAPSSSQSSDVCREQLWSASAERLFRCAPSLARRSWCVTAESYQSSTMGAILVQYPCSANPGGPEQYNLNAVGQLVSGNTNLCVTVNAQLQIQLEQCNDQEQMQIWQPMCPPSPPPPVAYTTAPCDGGAAMLAVTLASGAQGCLTGGASGYSVGAEQCVWSPAQLLKGFGSAKGLAFAANQWCANGCPLMSAPPANPA